MSCGGDRRRGPDLVLLWLWCRPAATAPIRPLAWEPSYAVDAAIKRQKTKTEKKTRTRKRKHKQRKREKRLRMWGFFVVVCLPFFCLFAFSRATPVAYGGSRARSLIGAVAAGLLHSHSNARSEPHL